MLSELMSVLFLGFNLFYLSLFYFRKTKFERKCRLKEIAFLEVLVTFNDLMNWIFANPEIRVGDSCFAKSLVIKHIEAYKRSWIICAFVTDNEYILFLQSLLDDHGPEPPRKVIGFIQAARKSRAVLFYIFLKLKKYVRVIRQFDIRIGGRVGLMHLS